MLLQCKSYVIAFTTILALLFFKTRFVGSLSVLAFNKITKSQNNKITKSQNH